MGRKWETALIQQRDESKTRGKVRSEESNLTRRKHKDDAVWVSWRFETVEVILCSLTGWTLASERGSNTWSESFFDRFSTSIWSWRRDEKQETKGTVVSFEQESIGTSILPGYSHIPRPARVNPARQRIKLKSLAQTFGIERLLPRNLKWRVPEKIAWRFSLSQRGFQEGRG